MNIDQYIASIDLKKDILLDVRTKAECKTGMIPGAINIPMGRVTLKKLDAKKNIYVYCRSGHRAQVVVDRLLQNGYRAINIGGILDYTGVKMKKIDVKDFDSKRLVALHQKPMLIVGGDEKKANCMTAGWGMIGVMWSVPSVMIAVRQSRYTKEFLDNGEYFSLCFFNEPRPALGYLGTVSGRDEDKVAKVGYHFGYIDGVPYIQEADAILICKKTMDQYLGPKHILDKEALKKFYGRDEDVGDYHDIYFGKIISCFTK